MAQGPCSGHSDNGSFRSCAETRRRMLAAGFLPDDQQKTQGQAYKEWRQQECVEHHGVLCLLASAASGLMFIARALDRSGQHSLAPSFILMVHFLILTRLTRRNPKWICFQQSDLLMSFLLQISPGVVLMVVSTRLTITGVLHQRLAFG